MTKCKHGIADMHVVLGDDNEVECNECGQDWHLYDYLKETTLTENNRMMNEVSRILSENNDDISLPTWETIMEEISKLHLKGDEKE